MASRRIRQLLLALPFSTLLLGCVAPAEPALTFTGSVVGREGEVIRRQLARFEERHGINVVMRVTPDAADQRHQLYVQWLNGRAVDPDVVQLDVVWVAEFAAAGWVAPLDRFAPDVERFFPPTIGAGRWDGSLFALPWFVDVGMLYWRTDLLPRAPRTLDELTALAAAARNAGGVPFGLVLQGARYEGLVTVFVELLGAFGAGVLDASGRVVVDSDRAVAALTWLRDAVGPTVPAAALTWQEEQSRFAFQNGEAALMRNWPYAYALLQDPAGSRVAGRFAVASMPAGPGGRPTATLGGAVLAINAFSDRADAAYRLIDFLLQPAQMLERARLAGQFPPVRDLYETADLAQALAVPAADARGLIEAAVPRPVSPVYSELSSILQIALHRALTGQQEPRPSLRQAAAAMRALLVRSGLTGVRARPSPLPAPLGGGAE
jgi:ABC-type glycerol-3-phosphate transport system substrate-binding protein